MIDLLLISGVFALSALSIAIMLIVLHKIRRVHIATYEILNSGSTRRETSELFAQFQALMALERKLALPEALPPMRGWAGSPDFLVQVAEEVFTRRPTCVMECSSGVSTLVIARCLQLNGGGHAYSLEHEPAYAKKTRQLLSRYGLTDWATILDAPLERRHTITPWYSEEIIPIDLPPIELLVIDGPPGSSASLAREPALPRLNSRMAQEFTVLIDDADRPDEIEMVRRWQAQWPHLEKTQLQAEKGLVRLRKE